MKTVGKSFFSKPTLELAKDLLGTVLFHYSPDGTVAGRIVETEAYLENDAASHSFMGQTVRNATMFGPAGYAYVYFIYGVHNCFNVVSSRSGKGEAVLIRALEPLEGIALMKKRRGVKMLCELTNGPGKLCIALGISREHNGSCLRTSPIRICRDSRFSQKRKPQIVCSKRIGISKAKDLPYRFYFADSTFVSKKNKQKFFN
jgi:DNA-3-methyladenine glycosylase